MTELKQSQKDVLETHRVRRKDLAETLLAYLDNMADARHVLYLERQLRYKNSMKWLPRCHVKPAEPQTLYISLSVEDFLANEGVVNIDACIATTNAARALVENRIAFVVNEFETVCCPRSIFDFFISNKVMRNDLKEKMSKSWVDHSMYVIRPNRLLDACDIISCPDKELFSSFPEIIQRRITRYGIPDREETNDFADTGIQTDA